MSSRSNAGLKLILLPQPPKPGLMFSTDVQSLTVQIILSSTAFNARNYVPEPSCSIFIVTIYIFCYKIYIPSEKIYTHHLVMRTFVFHSDGRGK